MNEGMKRKFVQWGIGDKRQGVIQGCVISTLSPEDDCSTVCDLTDAM